MAEQRTVLIVDDDHALRGTLAQQLAVDGEFIAIEADCASAAEALVTAKKDRFAAIILDINLPDADGRDLCAQLRRMGVKVPIIMLTGLGDESDVVRGLDSGANDYVAKPFRLGELLARLRAQLRLFDSSEDAVFQLGPYLFTPGTKQLSNPANQSRIRLTEKEVQILRHLLRAGDQPVPRETLLHEVWGYSAGINTHTLETHIYRLRQKLEQDPAHSSLLVTEVGGYRLNLTSGPKEG